jgi:hypothetical protein
MKKKGETGLHILTIFLGLFANLYAPSKVQFYCSIETCDAMRERVCF